MTLEGTTMKRHLSRKLTALLIALCLMLAFLPVYALAGEAALTDEPAPTAEPLLISSKPIS